MKLVGDARAAAWLAGFEAKVTAFDWDSGNQTKNRKHGVERADVEAIFTKPFVFEGRIIEPIHAEPRWLVLGEDGGGRRLAVVFTRRGVKLRPISCRPMREKERVRYEEAINQEDEGDSGGP